MPKGNRYGTGGRKAGEPLVKATVPMAPVAWHKDPRILARLERVEALRMRGLSAFQVSQQTGIPYSTVLLDFKRLNELATARLTQSMETHRAAMVRRLDGVIRASHTILQQDQAYTEAVLFGVPVDVQCPGRVEHRTEDMLMQDVLGDAGFGGGRNQRIIAAFGTNFTCMRPHPIRKFVQRDEKGAAQYRRVAGQVLTALNTAIMNQSKLLGLVVEKRAPTDADGYDLPSALRQILLGEDEGVDVAKLPSANEDDQIEASL